MKKLLSIIVLLVLVIVLSGCKTSDNNVLEDMIAQCLKDVECISIIQREFNTLEQDRELREEVYNAFIIDITDYVLNYVDEGDVSYFMVDVWAGNFDEFEGSIFIGLELSRAWQDSWKHITGSLTDEDISNMHALEIHYQDALMAYLNELVIPFEGEFIFRAVVYG